MQMHANIFSTLRWIVTVGQCTMCVRTEPGKQRRDDAGIGELREVTPPTQRSLYLLAVASCLCFLYGANAGAQSLRGSRASVDKMYRQAVAEDFTFLEKSSNVRKFVSAGLLVELEPTEHYLLHRVSYPYVRPQVRTFVERIASQYSSACGEMLVVTSAVRPASRQPSNSTDKSVHPTGMAIDLRKPQNPKCLQWLRKTLLALEKSNVLEATEERSPAHFHVAVFPTRYKSYLATITRKPATTVAVTVSSKYTVRPGDTLWQIARAHDTTVDAIADANELDGEVIWPGQALVIPSSP